MRTIIIAAFFLASCTAAKVSVPDQFGSVATSMKVSGLNGWMLNQQLRFGEYSTTPVKRGWDFSSSMQHSRISFRLEDQVLKVFNIGTDNRSIAEKSKMQYTVRNGTQEAAVFAMEKFSEKQLVFKASQSRLGELIHTRNLQYAFSAAIVLLSDKKPEPWQLVMVHRQHETQVTEEAGYATNGDITISINPLRIGAYTNPKGKHIKVAGGPMFAGYELKIDDGLIAVVDVLDNQVWMINEMDSSYKMVVAAVTSSLMLKKKQDLSN